MKLIIRTALAVSMIFTAANAYSQNFRVTAQTERILTRLETNIDRFSRSIDAALDRSRLNDSNLEDQVNALVDEFEFATDRLKRRVDDNMVISLDVNEVLRRGMYLDMFMLRHNLSAAAQRDWRVVRNDLDRLARVYGVTWTWVPKGARNSTLTKASTKQVHSTFGRRCGPVSHQLRRRDGQKSS